MLIHGVAFVAVDLAALRALGVGGKAR
jgi:hypothetical protein